MAAWPSWAEVSAGEPGGYGIVAGPRVAAAAAEEALHQAPSVPRKPALETLATDAAPAPAAPSSATAAGPACADAPHSEATATDVVPVAEAASEPIWKKYRSAGGQGCWWWNEETEDWFLEDAPGVWTRFADPESAKIYWWKDDVGHDWFWEHSGGMHT